MPASLMDPAELLACVAQFAATLQAAGVHLPCPSALANPSPALLQKLPPWIARFGALIEGKDVWSYFEPDNNADANSSGQVLICLPEGRYFVDTFDKALRGCIARESAEGDPLVVGLVSVSGPFLLWIRPIS